MDVQCRAEHNDGSLEINTDYLKSSFLGKYVSADEYAQVATIKELRFWAKAYEGSGWTETVTFSWVLN